MSTHPTMVHGRCHACLGVKRTNSLQDAVDLAVLKGGRCLSGKYENSYEKLLWKCHNGHEWKASFNMVRRGRWCPECYKAIRGQSRKIGIDAYKETAIRKNGICLSEHVDSCYGMLSWQCSKGHVWQARACYIKNTNAWCPECHHV